MALFIIFLIIAVGSIAYQIYKTVSLVKTPMVEIDYKALVKKNIILTCIFGVSFTLMLVGSALMRNFDVDATHYCKMIFGGLFFGLSISFSVNAFILFYYGKNIPEKLNTYLYYGFMAGFVCSFVTLFLFLDGFAPYFTYPLYNGVNFSEGLVRPLFTDPNPNLAFYAVCILSGALLVYAMCDHFMYKEYGKHGILESTFLVAFPAGIIGARLWYCIGDGVPFADWIKIWEGGLTILGGAVMGITIGVLWFLWRNKNYSIWVAVDVIVPTILIAQAVGRFGNFFNCEVHGELVSMDSFKWLPEIIVNNSRFSESLGFAPSGQIYVPLFFIEGCVNVLGYFFIAHVLGKACKKVIEPGDLAISYIVWYGMTRVLMEPLRNSTYNMGGNGFWSWIWSIVFVVAGTILILINHVIRFIIRDNNKKYIVKKYDRRLSIYELSVFFLLFLVSLILGCVFIKTGTFVNSVKFSKFNVGIILLSVAVSLLCLIALATIRLVKSFSNSEVNENE